MNSINNNYTNQTSLRSQSSQSSSAAQAADKADKSEKKSVKLAGSEIVVSSRAQKLKALANEFFNSGVNATNIAALKERAYEYGLLTQTQYNSLTTKINALPNAKQGDEKTTQSLAQQLNKLDQQIDKRNKALPEDKQQDTSKLSAILSQAATILKDPETAITKEQFSKTIETSIKDLNSLIDSDSFTNLPVNERVAITNSVTALSVIESLAPRNLSNNKLNQYLANSYR